MFNYLCISTITGRNASVSGDERYFDKQTWIEASSELEASREERAPKPSSGCPVHGGRAEATRPAPLLELPAGAQA